MFANSVFLAQKSGEDIGLREILNFVSQSHSAYQPPLHLEEPQTEWKLRNLAFTTVSSDK